jgi:hypothetical protein
MSTVVQSVDADSLFHPRPMGGILLNSSHFAPHFSGWHPMRHVLSMSLLSCYAWHLVVTPLSLFKIVEMFCCLSSRRERWSTRKLSQRLRPNLLCVGGGIECLESGYISLEMLSQFSRGKVQQIESECAIRKWQSFLVSNRDFTRAF